MFPTPLRFGVPIGVSVYECYNEARNSGNDGGNWKYFGLQVKMINYLYFSIEQKTQ